MRGLNKAYLIGHLGADPENKVTASGKAVATLRVATPHSRKLGEQWVDQPDWHRLTAWERDAEFLGRHAHKGDLIGLECSIRQGKYMDKEGVQRHKTDLVIDRVLFVNNKRVNETGFSAVTAAMDAPGPVPPMVEEAQVEEDVPF